MLNQKTPIDQTGVHRDFHLAPKTDGRVAVVLIGQGVVHIGADEAAARAWLADNADQVCADATERARTGEPFVRTAF